MKIWNRNEETEASNQRGRIGDARVNILQRYLIKPLSHTHSLCSPIFVPVTDSSQCMDSDTWNPIKKIQTINFQKNELKKCP